MDSHHAATSETVTPTTRNDRRRSVPPSADTTLHQHGRHDARRRLWQRSAPRQATIPTGDSSAAHDPFQAAPTLHTTHSVTTPAPRPLDDDIHRGSDNERGARTTRMTPLSAAMAADRRTFITHYAEREGITSAVLKKRWTESKNGYPVQYDGHFRRFHEWFTASHPSIAFCPTDIRPGILAEYLRGLSDSGTHHDVLRDISTSISMACREASDDRHRPGAAYTVTSLFEVLRRQKPVRRRGTGNYHDVALLYEQLWLYGPSSAMTLGHKKERIIALLLADTGARPDDLSKLYRAYDGWQSQIDFCDSGVRVRFFYPKEVVPGSARDNATGYYFSSWVNVRSTTPVEISTPECLRDFINESSSEEFMTTHISELDADTQPLLYGKLTAGKYQPASVDHISNVAKRALLWAGMHSMTARSIRGASPSKIVQIYPDLLPQALELGRWTNRKTFLNHYQAKVNLRSKETPPAACKDNLQQLLRWGFKPRPPPNVSAQEYMQGPDYWLNQTFPGLGRVTGFNEGVYTISTGGADKDLYHYELMAEISTARTTQF